MRRSTTIRLGVLVLLVVGLVGAAPASGQDGSPDVRRRITGTEGPDDLFGTIHHDHIDGLGGRDEIHGRRRDDRLIGGAGNDKLYAGRGSDLLEGGEGDDQLHSGPGGTDTLDGGPGNDTCWVDHPTQGNVGCEALATT